MLVISAMTDLPTDTKAKPNKKAGAAAKAVSKGGVR
jgi:hypothetical protein